jgi:NAD(P)-dependent dehydrogenase (short-subunit alcohol dehydrogenase family)
MYQAGAIFQAGSLMIGISRYDCTSRSKIGIAKMYQKAAYKPWIAYGDSKVANIVFASALARKLKSKGIIAFSVHPGCESFFS